MLEEEFLKPLGLSQTELAAKLGVSYPRVNELVHGKRGVTPDTALRLERLFGMEALVLAQPPVGVGPLSRAAFARGPEHSAYPATWGKTKVVR